MNTVDDVFYRCFDCKDTKYVAGIPIVRGSYVYPTVKPCPKCAQNIQARWDRERAEKNPS